MCGIFLRIASIVLLTTGAAIAQSIPLRITTETGPLGSTVQVKIFAARPVAITAGTLAFTIDGITENPPTSPVAAEVFSASEDATGFAYVDEFQGFLLNFSSGSGGVGQLPGVPIVELSFVVDKPHTISLDMSASSLGGYAFIVEPGGIAVGGTLTVANVYPGGGIVPPGIPIQLSGTGFTFRTTVSIDGASIASTTLLSSNEMLVSLAAPTEMTGKHILVQNPDGQQADYWSWLHGNNSGNFFAIPIFPSSIPSLSASCSPRAPPGFGVFLAIQNPGSAPAAVTFTTNLVADGTNYPTSATLDIPPGSTDGLRGTTASQGSIEYDFTSPSPVQVWCLVTGFDLRAVNVTLAPVHYRSQAPPAMASIVNSASLLNGSVSPGEIITIFGSGFADSGVSVLFDNLPTPIVFQSASQVNAIVPYELAAENVTIVQVQLNNSVSPPWGVPVTAATPAIFTLDSSGVGQAAVVNQNGTVNGPSNPAPIGSLISIYATGAGQTSPASLDGQPAAAPLPQPLLPVTVIIGTQTVTPQYAGAAPGEVAGVLQVNVQIPNSIQPGNAVPVTLQIGNNSSQTATIAVSSN